MSDDVLNTAKAPVRISFEPTIACNLNCPMCDRTKKDDYTRHQNEKLPYETTRAFMHEAGCLGVRYFLFIGLFALFTVRTLGSDAAWLSNAVVDVLCIAVVLISVICYKKRFDLSVSALLKLPDGFGAKENEYMTFSATRMEDVTSASEKVVDFCIKNAFPKKIAYHVGLCVEEMAGNVLEHGFEKSGAYYADIRVVIKGEALTVRIRDNCREFDPRKRIDLYDPAHPEKNIGIRITSQTARQIDYYNNAGINTLIMKF